LQSNDNGKYSDIISGVLSAQAKDVTPRKSKKKIQKYDKRAIFTKCNFMKSLSEDGFDLTDQTNLKNWDEVEGFISIARHVDGGKKLIHEAASKHPSYKFEIIEQEIKRQEEYDELPYTCKELRKKSDRCGDDDCGKTSLVSPLLLKLKDTTPTEITGFRKKYVGEDGAIKIGPPEYDDLAKYADREFGYFTFGDNGASYKYLTNKHYWGRWSETEIKAFIEDHLDPGPNNAQAGEFLGKVKRTNVRSIEESDSKIEGYLNLRNGVLNMRTGEFYPHSKDWTFLYCLDYDYDPKAGAPMFEKFLDDITCGRKELSNILMEFVGYGLSNDTQWLHKALLLHGEGANGKSTFLKIIQGLVGENNYSSVSISSLGDPQQVAMLQGRLFNIKGESGKALYDCEEFKEVTSGESVNAKVVYEKPFKFKPKAKCVVACNHLPKSFDTSSGFFRRMLLVPFDATFEDGGVNTVTELDKKILEKEASGVLNMAIEAYKKLREQGGFTKSDASSDLLKEYAVDNIPEVQFFEECYTVDPSSSSKVTLGEMYEHYRKWALENGMNLSKLSVKRIFAKILKNKILGLKEREKRLNSGMIYEGVYAKIDTSRLYTNQAPPPGIFDAD
jgi:putative DNA primase/helicase